MLGRVLNTHQQWLCRRLADLGYVVSRQVCVPDTGPAIEQAVRESLVLLRNDGVLPLDRRRKVVVVGSHADNVAYQCGGWTKKWQGAHTDLYGHPARPVAGATSILAGIREVVGDENVVDAGVTGFSDAADVAIVVVGETPYAESEGDRKAQDLVLAPEQRDLIARYHDAGKKVVVVLVSGLRILAVPALLAGRLTRAPVVLKADSVGEFSGEFFRAGLAGIGLTPSSAPVRVALWLRNRLLRHAAAFVAISDGIADEFVAQGLAPQHVHRIPNGVDTQRFRHVTHHERTSLRIRLGLPSGPVVVYTGRLVSYKGLPLLVEAWRKLVPEFPGAVLVLVGEGGGDMHDCERALREFVAQHGLEPQIRFTGPASNVQEWLQAADAFAFPTENEAFGLSLVEAMACGLPAVTTRVGGLRDFVEHGVNAWAMEAGDAAELTAGLRAVLTDQALAARLGARARETVLARFGEEAVSRAYEQLLDAARRGSRPGVTA